MAQKTNYRQNYFNKYNYGQMSERNSLGNGNIMSIIINLSVIEDFG